jgi:DNA invertase Pin-like site-specific DNA recombinase
MRCLRYCRFSPRPDAETSQSNAKQLADLTAYALRQGWTVDESDQFSDEAISGDSWSRPGLMAAIGAVGPGSVLLAYSVDRIARDSGILAGVLAQVFSRSGSICTIENGEVKASDPVSRLLCTIIGALAEFQKAMIRKRSSNALRRKLESGKLTGYPKGQPLPYGWRWIEEASGTVEPDLEEQDTLEGGAAPGEAAADVTEGVRGGLR